jgi:hypothetical protein
MGAAHLGQLAALRPPGEQHAVRDPREPGPGDADSDRPRPGPPLPACGTGERRLRDLDTLHQGELQRGAEDDHATDQHPLQKPSKKFQYAAAVTSTGIAYVARSGPKCGADVKIVRYFGATDDADGTVVADLGTNGRDFWSAYARANADGSVDVFYDRYVCGTGKSDIYRINDPHPGP